MMKRLLILLIILLSLQSHPLSAQQRLRFSVGEFRQDPLALSARSDQYKRQDDNGTLYSIIKVKSDIPNDDMQSYRFDFGYINSFVELHDDTNELWVYVQKNAKQVSISREGYTTITFDLGTTIGAGCTYEMQLQVQTPEVKKRVLQFKVSPADEGAIVKVKREDSDGEYELWGTVDATGSKARLIETGIYLYEITAEHYDKSVGRVILNYADDNHVEDITLRPNFGYLEVADENGIAGAEIYVNDRRIGTVPYTAKEHWEVGENYRILISRGELYKTFSSTFAIRKGETTRIVPHLEANFAQTTLKVDNNAEIFVDGASQARGTWTGPLKAGTYNVECRLDSRYRSTRRQITVQPNRSEIFVLEAPVPVTGSIYVSSDPLGADIKIDGKDAGRTPRNISDILIGQHTVLVARNGYHEESRTIDVADGQTAEVEFTLRQTATANKDAAARKDPTPAVRSELPRPQGNERQHKPTCGYLQASFAAGTLIGVSAHLGAYLKNVNLEACATFGLSKGTAYLHYVNGTSSTEETLKPTFFGGRVGYGIPLGQRFRITPQAGAGVLTAKSDNVAGSAVCANVAVRLDFAVNRFFGINLTPEAQFAVSRNDTFVKLADISSKVKRWATGGGVTLGLYVCF